MFLAAVRFQRILFILCVCVWWYFLVWSVLQSLDEASCRGLKHLLLGAIHKCHGNMRDALQVWAQAEYVNGAHNNLHCQCHSCSHSVCNPVITAGCQRCVRTADQLLCATICRLWTGMYTPCTTWGLTVAHCIHMFSVNIMMKKMSLLCEFYWWGLVLSYNLLYLFILQSRQWEGEGHCYFKQR